MKKFFRRIVGFLSTLFVNLNTWIHEHIQPSIETIQRLKTLFDNPVVDALTAIIPGDADDKLKDWIRTNLDKAIVTVAPLAVIFNEPDTTQKILKLIEWIKTLSPSLQKGVFLRLASEMAISSNGGKDSFKGHAVDLLTQMQYSKLAEGVTHTDVAPNYCKDCGQPQL